MPIADSEIQSRVSELLLGYEAAGKVELSGINGTSSIQDAQTIGTPEQMSNLSMTQGQMFAEI